MAHVQKPDLVFQRNGRVHLYRRGCQFSRVLTFLECGSGENDCSNTGWTVPSQTEDCFATHSIRLFPLHFSSPASPCATRFRFRSTYICLLFSSLPVLEQGRSQPVLEQGRSQPVLEQGRSQPEMRKASSLPAYSGKHPPSQINVHTRESCNLMNLPKKA